MHMFWIPLFVVIFVLYLLFNTVLTAMKATEQTKEERKKKRKDAFMERYCDKGAELQAQKEVTNLTALDYVRDFMGGDDVWLRFRLGNNKEAAVMIILAKRGKVYRKLCTYGVTPTGLGVEYPNNIFRLAEEFFTAYDKLLHEQGIPAHVYVSDLEQGLRHVAQDGSTNCLSRYFLEPEDITQNL